MGAEAVTCKRLPRQVWHKDEIWQVYGGCVCCGLFLTRTTNVLEPMKSGRTFYTTALPGEWVEWEPKP